MRLHASQHAVRGGARDPPRMAKQGAPGCKLLLLEGPRISQMLYSDHLFHLETKINGLGVGRYVLSLLASGKSPFAAKSAKNAYMRVVINKLEKEARR